MLKKTGILLGLMFMQLAACSQSIPVDIEALDQKCIKLEAGCVYSAIQKRDQAGILALANATLKQQIEVQPEVLKFFFDTVPTVDPISVEFSLDEVSPSQNGLIERIYFYVYDNQVIRLRLIYDLSTPTPTLSGIWVTRVQ